MLEIGMVECFNVVNLVHLHLQFLSKQHGQRSVNTLSHLSTGYAEVDASIRCNVQIGRQD